eukprot:GHVS01064083.1.p1 GENE.GHVS01064083.1~~GHVS01064083.1.p1  ORF type:complete len:173 (-),score=20.82 GHVS01064083.1:160-678(-)
MLRYDFIDPFTAQLQEALCSQHRFAVLLRRRDVDIYPNELFNRFFAGIPVETFCTTELISPLIDKINNVLTNFGLAKYYEELRPHVSLAWTTNERITTKLPPLEASTGQIWKGVQDMCRPSAEDTEVPAMDFVVKQIHVKIGKVVTKFDLNKTTNDDTSSSEEENSDDEHIL